MKYIKALFVSSSIAASLVFAVTSAQAGGCCGSQASAESAEVTKAAVVAPATVNAAAAEPAERGFFGRFFSRFSSSRSCDSAAKSGCCPAEQKAHKAVLAKNKDKDESKSGGCCSAQAASLQLASADSNCGDKADCGKKANCGDKADCSTKVCPASAKSCDEKPSDKCSPCTRAVSAPVATAVQ
jgi:hypothetical protein